MSQQQPKISLAIIGAGIAGLTAAIALQNQPHIDVHIYERATELREVGATIALGPNGLRILDRLGISDALGDDVAFRNTSARSMIYRHWKTDEVISADVHHGPVEYRHRTARFYRPHLQRVLLSHIEPHRLHLNKAFESISRDPSTGKLLLTFKDDTSITTDLVLGADGIHSRVRQTFIPTSSTKFTGSLFYRSVFPASHVSHIPDLPTEAVHYWGPDRAFFVSPLAQDLFAVVGTQQTDPSKTTVTAKWDEDGSVDDLKENFKEWSPLVRAIIEATPFTKKYPNTAARELDTWVLGSGRVTLAGDAAHAHGGAFAAGGSLAINDAWAFAASLLHVFPAQDTHQAHTDDAFTKILRLYEKTRKPHTDRLQRIVQDRNQGLIEQIDQSLSDEEVRHKMTARDHLSWLHEHDVEAAFAKAVAETETPPEVARL